MPFFILPYASVQKRGDYCCHKISHNLPSSSSCCTTPYFCSKPSKAKDTVEPLASLLPPAGCCLIEVPALARAYSVWSDPLQFFRVQLWALQQRCLQAAVSVQTHLRQVFSPTISRAKQSSLTSPEDIGWSASYDLLSQPKQLFGIQISQTLNQHFIAEILPTSLTCKRYGLFASGLIPFLHLQGWYYP